MVHYEVRHLVVVFHQGPKWWRAGETELMGEVEPSKKLKKLVGSEHGDAFSPAQVPKSPANLCVIQRAVCEAFSLLRSPRLPNQVSEGSRGPRTFGRSEFFRSFRFFGFFELPRRSFLGPSDFNSPNIAQRHRARVL